MLQLPAIPDPTWPIGKDADENKVVRTWADPSMPPAKLEGGRKDHIALGTARFPEHDSYDSFLDTYGRSLSPCLNAYADVPLCA